jgi:hypothetical protein
VEVGRLVIRRATAQPRICNAVLAPKILSTDCAAS